MNWIFCLNLSDIFSNTINNNEYIDPFGTDEKLFGICQNYSEYAFYTLPEWKSTTGMDASSHHKIDGYAYDAGLGIAKDKFVKLLLNLSDKSIRYDLTKLDAYFTDINGNPAGDAVTIPPYYSAVLFYKSARISGNSPPLFNDQFFNLSEDMHEGAVIGTLLASDSDPEQKLTYSIISGNESGLFSLDPERGELKLLFQPDFTDAAEYSLAVRVSDDGSPAMTAQASISINQIKISDTYFIDPDNANDPLENGSLSHPFDAWSDIKWMQGSTYLQKRGTVSQVDRLLITSGEVSLGAYGEGELPVIQSSSTDFVFSMFEKSNITFKDLDIRKSAVSLVYFCSTSDKLLRDASSPRG
jgi:hypothetical protein